MIPRRRFITVATGATFSQAYPITPEDAVEADALWEAMIGGNYSPEKKKDKKPAKKAYYAKEDPAEDINDRHVANADGAIFYDADP